MIKILKRVPYMSALSRKLVMLLMSLLMLFKIQLPVSAQQ
jgi:hypothetical protein